MNILRGVTGHPTHPPATDVAIGCYTFATLASIAEAVNFHQSIVAGAAYYALLVGLAATVAAAITGFLDYLAIPSATPLRKAATYHWLVMVTASVLFIAAAVSMRGTYAAGKITTTGLVLDLLGYAVMSVGGWLGGILVFQHGMRVKDGPSAE